MQQNRHLSTGIVLWLLQSAQSDLKLEAQEMLHLPSDQVYKYILISRGEGQCLNEVEEVPRVKGYSGYYPMLARDISTLYHA